MKTLISYSFDENGLVETNYFESEHAKLGLAHVVLNRRCFIVLLPLNSNISPNNLKDIYACDHVVVSRGPCKENKEGGDPFWKDTFEILFEDNTNTPFRLTLSAMAFAVLPNKEWLRIKFPIKFYNDNGKMFEKDCYYRIVKRIPWGKKYDLSKIKK